MPFKPGDIVYIKTTREPAFVLAVETDMEPESAFTARLTLRVPVATRDGIRHDVAKFFAEELETADDANRRELGEMNRKRELWEAQVKASQGNGQLELFPAEPAADLVA